MIGKILFLFGAFYIIQYIIYSLGCTLTRTHVHEHIHVHVQSDGNQVAFANGNVVSKDVTLGGCCKATETFFRTRLRRVSSYR